VAEEWFCYMLRCSDDSLYVGIAIDVEERVKKHNWGVGPEYTAKRRPVVLIWSERCGSSDAARRREKKLKGWNRLKKLALVANARAGWPKEPKDRGEVGRENPSAEPQGKGE
jgi:putative endonuclease